jgi:hypothetical protein
LATQATVGYRKTQVVHLLPVALVPVALVPVAPVALVPVAHLALLAQAAWAATQVVLLLPVGPPRPEMGETLGP